ncbi:lytic transglycosylase domain-containing protein [Pseudomarimonas salicorniae]|uniref:Transglycosylase SLT domain-containing protein n=1 Tax=Pseudomarimonas salicorniae TaxID=2933270 RepID=A0ABT0GJE0_9GAMM|nr:lytic transglycosylase domain-containing protein [Lysobacter sp. CAU 1642]MCK7594667.1 transglycosylase SLT domain-containing protein [Lysobacter sp. CAU 1642]
MQRLCVAVLVGVLAGCAAQPRTASNAAVSAHGAAEAAAEAWRSALAEWRAQRSAESAARLRDAGAALQSANEACAALPDCDTAPLLARYAELLSAQSELLVQHDEAGPDALALEGEGGALVEEGRVDLAGGPEAEIEGLQDSLALLKGRDLRELIALNAPVKAALNEWLTWMRPQLLESYENYQFMRHRMWPEYEAAGLPEALLFGILAKESAGKVHAVSRAGAAGPLQFMPATGARLGLGRDADGFDLRFDPQMSTRANVRYLNERFAEFNNDLALALAAYNGGEGRVGRLVRQHGRRSFWDAGINRQLPSETRDYVPMVLAAAWLFLHPEDYGLELPQVEVEPVALVLEQPASLNQLAICVGQRGSRSGWFRALRNLNPRHLPHTELAAGTRLEVPAQVAAGYREDCLAGELAEAALQLASAAKRHDSGAVAGSYTVRRGDTLASIARRHGCDSPESLARVNGIKPPSYLIRPGQSLRLAGCRG